MLYRNQAFPMKTVSLYQYTYTKIDYTDTAGHTTMDSVYIILPGKMRQMIFHSLQI